MDRKEIEKIIELHGKWLRDEERGERANLRSADLRSADLSSADLSYADLRYADLRYADLSYADLSYADLSSADLKGNAKIWQSDLSILKYQVGELRAFKYLDGDISPYQNIEYKVGKTYIEKDYDDDEKNLCGTGLNVATLDWCLGDTGCDLEKTYIEVSFQVKDIVAIPYASDGKFRVKKFKVLRKLSKKELETYLSK